MGVGRLSQTETNQGDGADRNPGIVSGVGVDEIVNRNQVSDADWK